MKKSILIWRLILIFLVLTGVFWIVQPTTKGTYFGVFNKRIELVKGLDISGGSHLVYEVDTGKIKGQKKKDAVAGVIQTIDRRINALGIAEPIIQNGKVGDKDIVIVELPGVKDTKEAIDLIGKTAQLVFYERPSNPDDRKDEQIGGFIPTDLTGSNLKKADISYQNTGSRSAIKSEPVVDIEFDKEGREKFAKLTKKNLKKELAIVIDSQIISAPVVQEEITQGKAVISGNFTIKSAKKLAIALNSGALPTPIKLVEQRTVGATLGDESIQKSIIAGIIGILLVMIFMTVYYKLEGAIASLALLIYCATVIAFFKFIPVTITLAGIAGFILSIGAAVDANILIFERTKEELNSGKGIQTSLDEGFKRAWSSIRDSNISSMITALILIWFGAGIIKGFAVTLLIGIIISMFSAITISQTFLKVLMRGSRS